MQAKSGKVWEKGDKLMPFLDKDAVLTTKEASEYLKFSSPLTSNIFALGGSWLSKQETAGGYTDPSCIDF